MSHDEYSKGFGTKGKENSMKRYWLIAAIVLTLTLNLSIAQELSWHGFLQTNYSLRTTGLTPNSNQSDFLWADQRLQLKLSTSEGEARAFTKVDLFQDALESKADLEIREAFLDYRLGDFDFRTGRQIITWGLGDLLFINDLFPKDWEAFFSGRPIEYLKIGVDGVKSTFSSSLFSLELAILPFFQPDNIPTSEKFFLYDPLASISNRTEEKPAFQFENFEQALRLYRTFSGFEVTIYAYRGFYRTPSVTPDSLPIKIIYHYPKLSAYGASVQKNLYNGIFSLEYGYYDSREDRAGDNPMIPNSFHKFLAGYQRQGWKDFSYSFQFYGEYMSDYSNYEKSLAIGFPKQDRFRQLLTARATQFLKYQTLKFSWFTFFSPSDNDYYLIPEVQYKISDKLWMALGGNIFGGERKSTFLGQFDKNDNTYLTLRYEF